MLTTAVSRQSTASTEINTQRWEGFSGNGGLLSEDRVRGVMRLAVTLMKVMTGGGGVIAMRKKVGGKW